MQNQTGSLGRIVGWISAAWNEVQTEHDDWDWMRSSSLLGAGVSFTTVAGKASYPLGTVAGTCGIATIGKWAKRSFRNFTTAVGFTNEIFMDDESFEVWRDLYMYGAQRTVQTRPIIIAVGPDNSLCVGPPPDATYTITGDYFVAPTAMIADIDVPTNLPVQNHMIIVYKAMMKYAAYESAPEVYTRGQTEYAKELAKLEALRLPQMGFAGSL